MNKCLDMKVDVLIIGAGGGAYPAAFRLAGSGKTVLMADPKGVLGGNCLYLGCIPSKTVRELIEINERSGRLLGSKNHADFRLIQQHKDDVQQMRFDQHNREMSEFQSLKFMKGKVSFTGKNSARVSTESEMIEVEFDYAIIATGTVVLIFA